MRKQEEPLPRNTTVIQPILRLELNHQPALKIFPAHAHHRRETVFQHPSSSYLKLTFAVAYTHLWLRAEVDKLSSIIALVLWSVGIELSRRTRIVPGCRSRVVVYKVNPGVAR